MSPWNALPLPKPVSEGLRGHLRAAFGADSAVSSLLAGFHRPRARSAAHPGLQVVQVSFSTVVTLPGAMTIFCPELARPLTIWETGIQH